MRKDGVTTNNLHLEGPPKGNLPLLHDKTKVFLTLEN